MYPEPDSFKPERFVNPDGSLRDDPVVTSLFGFGKRICPGRHLADATIFIVIASLLSVFNIKKGDGTEGGPDVYPFTGSGVRYGNRISLMAWERLTAGVSLPSRPCPFACSITPRDRKAEELILANSQIP
jgi:Cytochrome P450